jgi:fimbrial chaperone protein
MKISIAISRSGRQMILAAGVLGLLGISLATPAFAGLFTVTPVRIYLAPKDRATAITITNDGDEELVMQADIYDWKQKPDGQDELTPSEDLFLSPPIIKLAPKSRQVVRLAMVHPPMQGRQLTYRMIVREIPEARPADKTVQVQIALAFSMPVFITPPGAKRQLGCTVERVTADVVKALCENTGNAYTQIRELSLTAADGGKLASGDVLSGYILPDSKRGFDLKRTDGNIPSGKAKLGVSLDDGSHEGYDVDITE